MKPPEGCEAVLSEYSPVVFDGICGKPVGWGFRLLSRLGEDRFNALAAFGKLECLGGWPSKWVLVVKELTPEQAKIEYGSITHVELGPRGGFRSVTFGETRFCTRRLDPR